MYDMAAFLHILNSSSQATAVLYQESFMKGAYVTAAECLGRLSTNIQLCNCMATRTALHAVLSTWLQAWTAAVQGCKDKGINTAAVAAAAMFVLVVTRTNDQWASWSEGDNMFVRHVSSHSRYLCALACCHMMTLPSCLFTVSICRLFIFIVSSLDCDHSSLSSKL